MKNCDGCTECCYSLPINESEFVKQEGVMCTHCDKGCTIYDTRPESCKEFNCVYLVTNTDESLRPDKTNVIFEMIYTKIYLALVRKEFLDSWRTKLITDYINKLNEEGISVVVSSFENGLIEVFTAHNHNEEKVLEMIKKVI